MLIASLFYAYLFLNRHVEACRSIPLYREYEIIRLASRTYNTGIPRLRSE
jgi:hypothetical protein